MAAVSPDFFRELDRMVRQVAESHEHYRNVVVTEDARRFLSGVVVESAVYRASEWRQNHQLERPQLSCSVYPQWRKQLAASDALTWFRTLCIASHNAWRVRQAMERSNCLILEKTISMGFRSGL